MHREEIFELMRKKKIMEFLKDSIALVILVILVVFALALSIALGSTKHPAISKVAQKECLARGYKDAEPQGSAFTRREADGGNVVLVLVPYQCSGKATN